MELENRQAEQLMQNKDIRELIDLLKQNNPTQGKEYAALLGQVEELSQLLDKALQELREVRTQLGGQKESGIKQAVTKAVEAVEGRISAMHMAVSDMKERIVKGAREVVEGFKHGGTRALDMTVSLLGIKKGLKAMKNDLESSLQDVQKSIQKVERVGREMRSVGGHIRNAAYAVVGKEPLPETDRGEGRFQAAGLNRERGAVTTGGIRHRSGSESREVKTNRRLRNIRLTADKAADRTMGTRQTETVAGSGITWETEAAEGREKRKASIAARGRPPGVMATGNGRIQRTGDRTGTAAERRRSRTAAAVKSRKMKAGRGNRKNGGSGGPRRIPVRNRTVKLTGAGKETWTGRGNMRKPGAGWSGREKSWKEREKNSLKDGNSAMAKCRKGRAGSACTLKQRSSLSMRKSRSPKEWPGQLQRLCRWRRKENCIRK